MLFSVILVTNEDEVGNLRPSSNKATKSTSGQRQKVSDVVPEKQ
jgi:hypothetical protein